jgi:hypothetical protein
MQFFLGAKSASWLEQTAVPLFLTYSLLAGRVNLPRARGPWALDSNGFEMLRLHGRYTFKAKQYASDVQRYHREIGKLCFASVMDWMCEDAIRYGGCFGRLCFLGTRLSVREHQKRTIDSYLELRALAPEVPWMPVLQGSGTPDYKDMLDEYHRRGVDLWKCPRVGVGSVCRRQATIPTMFLLSDLLDMGLTIHAFGVKTAGIASVVRARGHDLASLDRLSADSMAWSMGFRFGDEDERHLKNKLEGALTWRSSFLAPYKARGLVTTPRPPGELSALVDAIAELASKGQRRREAAAGGGLSAVVRTITKLSLRPQASAPGP